VTFEGFEPADFELFAIEDFAGRMGAIRSRVRPKLIALGEDLNSRIGEITGLPAFPHVAQHMRRRVNPPAETWVAFCRDRKGYKRWTHYRVAVSGAGVRVTVFVEDDADDKPVLGASLEAAPAGLLKALGSKAAIQWYTLGGGGGLPHREVTEDRVRELGTALKRFKTAKFQAGVPLPREEAVRLKPAEFEAWALEQVGALRPLYLAGAQPG
jgi:uncharacterized protein YktB (UPF0637 family)